MRGKEIEALHHRRKRGKRRKRSAASPQKEGEKRNRSAVSTQKEGKKKKEDPTQKKSKLLLIYTHGFNSFHSGRKKIIV